MKNLTDKLLSRGAESLTDSELVAAIIAEGANDDRALDVAHELLDGADGSLLRLTATDFSRLRMSSGLGLRRAMRLKAATELGRRVLLAEGTSYDTITSDSDVARLMEPQIGMLKHEECWALYLASSGRVLDRMRISQGGVQATVVDHRLIVKRALELLAVNIILVHNHPSGSVEPSQPDKILTRKVKEAAALFDISLLDHIIISSEGSYSFRRNGIL